MSSERTSHEIGLPRPIHPRLGKISLSVAVILRS